MAFEISIFFRQAKIDDMYRGATSSYTHHEIVRFDVSVDERAAVDVLDPADHLQRQHNHRLEGELPVTVVEQVLQGRTQKIDHHRIVLSFLAEPPDERYANTSAQIFIHPRLVVQLRVFRPDGLQFDRHFFSADQVRPMVDVSKRP